MSGEEASGIGDIYRRHGAAWAANRGQQLIEKNWLDQFIALLGSERTVLDVGCGTGRPIGSYLGAQACEVTGVDSSPELLNMARELTPRNRWIEADMRELDLGQRFDGILAWHSFFHLAPDDQRSMFPIFRDHAKDGAALMFTSGVKHGVSIGTMEDEPLYHASLDPEEYRDLLASNGFEVVNHLVNDPDCARATVWLAKVGDV